MPASRRAALEIEIKLRVADVPSLLRKLRGIGAANHGRVFEQNTLYDTSTSDFRRHGLLLRVRTETPAPAWANQLPGGARRGVLTFKSPPARPAGRTRTHARPRYKQRLETELEIQRAADWPRILRTLGLRPAFRYEKYRSSFRLGSLHVDLDETPAGTFLELEGTPRQIDNAARALGYAARDYIQATYWDIHSAHCRRRGLIPKNMVFRS